MSLFVAYCKRSSARRACATFLLAFLAAWLGPTATSQSGTRQDIQAKRDVDAQLPADGVIRTGDEQAGLEIVNAASSTSHLNIRAQTACETELLHETDSHEVFSGKAYKVLTELSTEYGRATIPHIYIFPGSWNMVYIAGSTSVDGRGKILVGRQAIELFNVIALRGFLGHEMAHLVSDKAAYGCQDYIIRDPRMEADADALAARVLGMQPVATFLERVLALPGGRNSDAKSRLELLRSKHPEWTGY